MAINLASPGILVTETDRVAAAPSAGSTIGATAGQFRWGPIEDAVLVTNETELLTQFGKPNSVTIEDFLVAANFLSYSAGEYVVRAANTTAGAGQTKNATAEATTGSGTAGTGLLIKNDEAYSINYETGSGNVGPWAAKYAGALGNSLSVSTCSSPEAWESTLTGTYTVSVGSASVTGASGANVIAELVVGDIVILGGRKVQVKSIEAANAFTLTSAHLTGATAEATVERRWQYYDQFDGAPGTSTAAAAKNAVSDEMHVVVVDKNGDITGTVGVVLEKYQAVSKASDARSDTNQANYYKDVINTTSKYVRWMDHDAQGTNWGTALSAITYDTPNGPLSYALAGGTDGDVPTSGELISAFLVLANASKYEFGLLATGKAVASVVTRVIADVAEVRKDCIVCFSPTKASVVNNSGDEVADIKTFADSVPRSTYAFMDSNWKYQYDRYNDKYVWVPCNADVAGCMARTDREKAPWFSPAGYAQGRILNSVKLAWNPAQADRDTLYKYGINPIFTQPGRGTVLFGDKTFQTKTGSFSKINVRRLFITLEKTISTVASDVLFEQNDAGTRVGFVNTIEPYLRSVQAQRGMTQFAVICDATNNPDAVVNANEFVCDIYIRPTSSINFIQLNFVSVRGAAGFAEIG